MSDHLGEVSKAYNILILIPNQYLDDNNLKTSNRQQTNIEPNLQVKLFGVSTFTPRSIHISNAMFTRSLLLAISLAAGRRSASRYTYGGHS